MMRFTRIWNIIRVCTLTAKIKTFKNWMKYTKILAFQPMTCLNCLMNHIITLFHLVFDTKILRWFILINKGSQDEISKYQTLQIVRIINDVVRTLKKLRTSKGDYWIKQWFSSIASLYKKGTSLKKKICSQWEKQFLKVWKSLLSH